MGRTSGYIRLHISFNLVFFGRNFSAKTKIAVIAPLSHFAIRIRQELGVFRGGLGGLGPQRVCKKICTTVRAVQ